MNLVKFSYFRLFIFSRRASAFSSTWSVISASRNLALLESNVVCPWSSDDKVLASHLHYAQLQWFSAAGHFPRAIRRHRQIAAVVRINTHVLDILDRKGVLKWMTNETCMATVLSKCALAVEWSGVAWQDLHEEVHAWKHLPSINGTLVSTNTRDRYLWPAHHTQVCWCGFVGCWVCCSPDLPCTFLVPVVRGTVIVLCECTYSNTRDLT